ncbi:hypothetical protein A1O7_01471 [Cladophialophora yegresii CBS 114405]|uniref:Ubiquitin-like domain-containing protein n=1 Tax=Cladophialophora yegresii CBS 114405 TaxID=1182544 RepID=W9WKI3_9EURO|nr:uncharacterized protein A1O7_01471 [Cladophialophora yegresii CBS 114405]EXJ65131.1 hypothetical protein A1O7_01471 [Cladophialophora yegresii CBS 114405]
MDAPHQSDLGKEVKSDVTLSLPNPQANKTLVVFYKPIVVSVDLTTCQTLEDVDKAVRSQPEFESYDAKVFSDIHYTRLADGTPFTCEELGLTGKDCSKTRFPALTITPRPPERFDVHIWHNCYGDLSCKFFRCTVNVSCEDTVAKLKELVEERTGFNAPFHKLHFPGWNLLPEDHLLAKGIREGFTVTLTADVALHFMVNTWWIRVLTSQNTPLYHVLQSFAKNDGRDLGNLLFQIRRHPSFGSEKKGSWLPDRNRLFGAEEAKGTIAENGFQEEDQIHVFELNKPPATKRGLEDSQETIQSPRKRTRAAASTTGLSEGAK